MVNGPAQVLYMRVPEASVMQFSKEGGFLGEITLQAAAQHWPRDYSSVPASHHPKESYQSNAISYAPDLAEDVRAFMVKNGFYTNIVLDPVQEGRDYLTLMTNVKDALSGMAEVTGKVHDQRLQRVHLLLEELSELVDALRTGESADLLDAICDLTYVAVGTAVRYGLPFTQGWEEVHRSNMSKQRKPDDLRLRDKGPDYCPPDLESVITRYRQDGLLPM
jgi:hypothetical protein